MLVLLPEPDHRHPLQLLLLQELQALYPSLNPGQKCYFERPPAAFSSFARRHKPAHQLEVIFEPQVQQDKRYECFGCKREVLEHCWMCENCYNFFFCQKCFDARTDFKSLYANTHKKYHVLTKIF